MNKEEEYRKAAHYWQERAGILQKEKDAAEKALRLLCLEFGHFDPFKPNPVEVAELVTTKYENLLTFLAKVYDQQEKQLEFQSKALENIRLLCRDENLQHKSVVDGNRNSCLPNTD